MTTKSLVTAPALARGLRRLMRSKRDWFVENWSTFGGCRWIRNVHPHLRIWIRIQVPIVIAKLARCRRPKMKISSPLRMKTPVHRSLRSWWFSCVGGQMDSGASWVQRRLQQHLHHSLLDSWEADCQGRFQTLFLARLLPISHTQNRWTRVPLHG